MFDKNKVKLGIAPIAWTNDDMPDLGKENTFEQCVSEMALAGFTGSEVGNKYPKDPEVLKKALELRGVEICNQWFSSFLITKPFEEVEKEFRAQLTFLKAMGAKVIGASEQSHSVQGQMDTPVFGHKYEMNDEEWDTFCTGMNKLGKIAKEEYGIALTFHHHMGTVVQSLAEVDRMMENTDPEYVSLLFDTGHFTYCGEDPLEVVKKYVHRIKHVHLKDIRPEVVEQVKKENMSFLAGVRAGAFTIPGDGCINYDPIFKVLEDAGYEGYMVVEAEQDPAKANPLEYAIRAAEELDTPIILQIAEVRLKNSPLHLMGPMMVQAAKEAKVDVAVHLDHGLTFETVDKALELGFTSVMLDASTLPFEENIARVKAVVEKARKYGATVEAELGLVGGSEDGSCDHGIRCTDPDDAVVYARETGIDALAVAIGNAHGNYPVAPTLAFDVLEKIHEKVDIPLVLHGGSGITDKDFQRAISLGIRKVNIATASFNSLTAHVEKYMESTDKHNFFDLNEAMVQGTYENVKRHILVFNEPYQE